MLYTSEGLTFGLRPSALGLRSVRILMMNFFLSTENGKDFARNCQEGRLHGSFGILRRCSVDILFS